MLDALFATAAAVQQQQRPAAAPVSDVVTTADAGISAPHTRRALGRPSVLALAPATSNTANCQMLLPALMSPLQILLRLLPQATDARLPF
mmetsp:Transcript_106295/g.211169  ORF Transcript_106295/g.211169 Transcript_106295/m.211169 type:complete len:90 (-) Transcript_106295:589-858(-)